MLFQAFVLAFITVSAFGALYSKLPRKLRKWIEKHNLATDIVAMIGTYLLLGGTLTALSASAMAGLMVSGMLHVAKNPERFEYVVIAKEVLMDGISSVSDHLNSWAKSIKAERAQVIPASL